MIDKEEIEKKIELEKDKRGRKVIQIPENIITRVEELREFGLGYRKICVNINKEFATNISTYKVQKICKNYEKNSGVAE